MFPATVLVLMSNENLSFHQVLPFQQSYLQVTNAKGGGHHEQHHVLTYISENPKISSVLNSFNSIL